MKHSIGIFAFIFILISTVSLEANDYTDLNPISFNKLDIKRGNRKKYDVINPNVNDFVLLSIPKSGTHLMVKLLVMLSGKSPCFMRRVTSETQIENELLKIEKANSFMYHHTGNFPKSIKDDKVDLGVLLANYLKNNPNYVKIVQIRDLRDVFVSLVYYLDKTGQLLWRKSDFTPNSTFSDKLTYSIKNLLVSDIQNSLLWLNNPEIIVVRFEDIIGPQGGGDEEIQRKTIEMLANALGLELTGEKIQEITENLFGINSGPHVVATFHNGQIGAWKTHFNSEHIRLFNEIWGDYQLALGYPLAE